MHTAREPGAQRVTVLLRSVLTSVLLDCSAATPIVFCSASRGSRSTRGTYRSQRFSQVRKCLQRRERADVVQSPGRGEQRRTCVEYREATRLTLQSCTLCSIISSMKSPHIRPTTPIHDVVVAAMPHVTPTSPGYSQTACPGNLFATGRRVE